MAGEPREDLDTGYVGGLRHPLKPLAVFGHPLRLANKHLLMFL
jgi:hypothetical protein